jgi:hypothetical protein
MDITRLQTDVVSLPCADLDAYSINLNNYNELFRQESTRVFYEGDTRLKIVDCGHDGMVIRPLI